MTDPQISDVLKLAIAHAVDGLTDQIRDRARRDHADELDQAGHVEAAEFLRRPR